MPAVKISKLTFNDRLENPQIVLKYTCIKIYSESRFNVYIRDSKPNSIQRSPITALTTPILVKTCSGYGSKLEYSAVVSAICTSNTRNKKNAKAYYFSEPLSGRVVLKKEKITIYQDISAFFK